MSNESFLLLAIGVFLSLIIAVAAVDQFLLDEHPPSEVAGLIWRVRNAFSRIKDLEAVVEVTLSVEANAPVRMLVRFLNQPLPALSMRYLDPESLQGQVFTVQNDLLSHYIPQDKLIVVKRWVGLPLAAVGLAGLDLTQIERDWQAGLLNVQIVQNLPGFSADGFSSSVSLDVTLSNDCPSIAESLCPQIPNQDYVTSALSLAGDSNIGNTIRGEYILEARDSSTGQLSRIVWIDRETFFIQKVVYFVDGERDKTIQLQRITIDQGLTPEEVLTLPGGIEIVRG